MTVTLQVSLLLPYLAVIVAVPFLTAFTIPLEVTDATDLLLLVQVIFPLVPLDFKIYVFPTLSVILFWFSFAAAFTDTGIISMLTNKQHIRITDRFINLFILFFLQNLFLNYIGFYQNCIGRIQFIYSFLSFSHGLPSPDSAIPSDTLKISPARFLRSSADHIPAESRF